jgi:hypothetical protein
MHPQRVHLIATCIAAGMAACTAEDAPNTTDAEAGSSGFATPMWRPLASVHLWVQAEGPQDPFAALVDPSVACDPGGHGVEDVGGELGYEIDTGLCNGLSLVQTSLSEAPAGSEVRIRLWHEALDADEPARGYIGVAVQGEVGFEHEVAIPGPSGLIDERFELPVDADLQTPVVFHLHNHGINTWALLELSVLR